MLNVVLQCYNCRIKYFVRLCRLFSVKTPKPPKLKNNQLHDVIGPPDPVSNLRPVILASSTKETYFEKRYRELRKEAQEWNQIFWSKHNISFTEEREQFQQMLKAQGKMTTADDMSVFYKQFLDKNWQNHFDYNVAWYKRNIKIVLFGIAAKLSKLKFK